MTRTIAQAQRAKARREQRKAERDQYIHTFKDWKSCEWCGLRFNPSGPVKWLGKLICPSCADFPRTILHNMLDAKLVKLKKKSALPHRKVKGDISRWLGPDPNRPYLKWTKCGYCEIPLCMNNYPDRKCRIKRYKGLTICGKCRKRVPQMLQQLVEMNYLKIKEPK